MGGCDILDLPPIIGTPTITPAATTPPSTYTPPSTGTGVIYGQVVDKITGAFLDGVIIKLNGQIVTTSVDGSYSIEGLQPGTYTLTFEKEYYDTLTATITIPSSGQGPKVVQYNAFM